MILQQVILLLLLQTNPTCGPVWLQLSDKSIHDSYIQLTNRAIQRRNKFNISFNETDIPINSAYLNQLEQLGVQIRCASRWLNAISIEKPTNAQLQSLQQLSFIKTIEPVRSLIIIPPETSTTPLHYRISTEDYYGPSYNQNHMIQTDLAHARGYFGDGILICLTDVGYHLTHQAFQQLKVIATWDFLQGDSIVAKEEDDIAGSQYDHGTKTLSMIAGYLPGKLIGPAYNAEYLLAKTDRDDGGRTDDRGDEDRWIMAAEWADSLGADIISSSVGYDMFTDGFSYSWNDMDGDKAYITKAADIAASKGILVVTANGNSGPSPKTIVVPADGDSVLAAGAVNATGTIASFSSRGPTFDNRIKPDLCAQGQNVIGAIPGTADLITTNNGTSTSTPLIAGASALLLQACPKLNPFEAIQLMKNTATNKLSPDNDYGWGIVQINDAIDQCLTNVTPKIKTKIDIAYYHNFLKLHLPLDAPSSCTIFDLEGKIINTYRLSTATQEIPTSQLSSGIYLLQVKQNNTTYLHKFALVK